MNNVDVFDGGHYTKNIRGVTSCLNFYKEEGTMK